MHLKSPEELEQLRTKVLKEREKQEGKKGVVLCTGTGNNPSSLYRDWVQGCGSSGGL